MTQPNILKIKQLFWLITVILVSVFSIPSARAQQSYIRFEHITDRDGLSHNRVTSILQDDLGFMWFGTLSGLNRYDGSEVKVLRSDENDPFSLYNSNIIWIREGPEKQIWVKSSYGVYVYDIFTERFVKNEALFERLGVGNYNLKEMLQDKNGGFWFLIEEQALSYYDPETDSLMVINKGTEFGEIASIQKTHAGNISLVWTGGQVQVYDVNSRALIRTFAYPENIKNIRSLSAQVDKNGNYWFYSMYEPIGAVCYKPETGETNTLGEHELGSELVPVMLPAENGQMIIGVDHVGLVVFDVDHWSFERYSNHPADPKSLGHNTIVSLFQDNAGTIWVGSNKNGISYFSSKSATFNFYKKPGDNVLTQNDILQIVEAPNSKLWLGTDGGGLMLFDRKTMSYKHFSANESGSNKLSSDIIVSLCNDGKGGLWIGTYLGGLNHFDGKKFTHFPNDPTDPNSPADNSIWSIFIDSQERLWIGTVKSGVDVYDQNFQKILHFQQGENELQSSYVTSFAEDDQGRIWIGTGYGIDIYDPALGTFQHLLKDESNPNSLSNNSIVYLFKDQESNIWAGTMYGLNKFDLKTGKVYNYTKKDGLPENIITSIAQDEHGDLWLGTYKGLSRMTENDGVVSFRNFDMSDGLQGDRFNERAVAKLKNGELVFGGKSGINVFDGGKIEDEVRKEKLVFLDFYISNKQIKPGVVHHDDELWFEHGLNNTEEIVLDYDENSFTFGFTALNFYSHEQVMYKYRLTGFDSTWVVLPDVRRANYTNLDPGKYTFEVMASSQNNLWDTEPIRMHIVIKTPWWQTPLAYIIYSLVIAAVLFFTRKSIIQKERFRAKVQQERLESKQLHELDMMKIRFFTNISHEFRTPLTLIITPIERMMRLVKGKPEEEEYQVVYRNAKRLLTLVNQLLDFRKMEANQHKLSLSSGDLTRYVGDIVESFVDLAKEKQIHLNYQPNITTGLLLFDRDKLEKILFNLLSNAFKFTKEKGSITVSIRELMPDEAHCHLQLIVQDTGIGIPKSMQGKIFKRFFQVDNPKASDLNHGSGIGLSITKEFVELHGGNISVASDEGVGSTFTVELPLRRAERPKVESENDTVFVPQQDKRSLPIILICEDNPDFRNYLANNLRQKYQILEAADGKDGWKKVMSHLPDLIISDIMMPEMSGVDLCRKVKQDPRTAHVPVILLSAKYSDEQKLEGFEVGATEYITKPFNFEILLKSIKSTIQLQKQIHAVEHRMEVEPAKIEIESIDEKLIKNALEIVEQNISNAEFSVQELSRELGVSRGQLYKKTLELTGKTPIEFIRAIRLKRAATLLEKSQMTVAEVAYKVGFNNPKYFTKYFRAAYDVLPSKYAESLQNKG